MQHSSTTLEVYFRKVWKLLLLRLHHSDDIRVKSYVRIILGHPIVRIVCSGLYSVAAVPQRAEALQYSISENIGRRTAAGRRWLQIACGETLSAGYCRQVSIC